jgi:hypothetical protein
MRKMPSPKGAERPGSGSGVRKGRQRRVSARVCERVPRAEMTSAKVTGFVSNRAMRARSSAEALGGALDWGARRGMGAV